MREKGDIGLINLAVSSVARRRNRVISAEGDEQTRGNGEWQRGGEREEAYFARIQGHVMNAKIEEEDV